MPHEFRVGSPTVIESPASSGRFAVVFEDDGDTGYAYGVRRRRFRGPEVLDALHLYNVAAVSDRAVAHHLDVRWASDGTRAAVFLNGHVHAAFAFAERRACNMTAFPPPSAWCTSSHEWDPTLVAFLATAS